jgi:hypothetical protein
MPHTAIHLFFLMIFLFGAISLQAKTIEKEDASGFIIRDEVAFFGEKKYGEVWVVSASDADWAGSPGEPSAPYRFYTIAIPDFSRPEISFNALQTEEKFGRVLGGIPKQSPSGSESPVPSKPAQVKGLIIGEPEYKNGLNLLTIGVPLVEYGAVGYTLIKSYRLSVLFPKKYPRGRAKMPERLKHRVQNPRAAAFFYNPPAKQGAATLAKRTLLGGVEWLAEVAIGDRDHSTFSEDGFYALTFRQFESALEAVGAGQQAQGIPVNSLRLFSGSPDTLSEKMAGAILAPNQLWEIPIEIKDHSRNSLSPDGTFDEGDTLIFFGRGSSFFKRTALAFPGEETLGLQYYFSSSPYDFSQKYYIGIGGGNGLRLQTSTQNTSPTQTDSTTLHYIRAEKDLLLRDGYFENVTGIDDETGKEWFWIWADAGGQGQATSSQLTQDHTRDLPGLIPNDTALISLSFFPYRSSYVFSLYAMSGRPPEQRYPNPSFVNLTINGALQPTAVGRVSNDFIVRSTDLAQSANSFDLSFTMTPTQWGRFDGYSIAYPSEILYREGGQWLLPRHFNQALRYKISNAPSDLRVLRVKDGQAQALLAVNNGTFMDSVGATEDIRYFISRPSDLRTAPDPQGQMLIPNGITNNLLTEGGASIGTEYLLITPQRFNALALELRDFRRNGSAISEFKTEIVQVESIYQHYSSGKMSPAAIRDYLRYCYNQNPSLKYVLLVGDGHFDYRQLKHNVNQNHIPPWEREDQASDDFFVVLDSGEVMSYGAYDRDLLIGRLPIQNENDFRAYLNKVREYEGIGQADYSEWRNQVLLTADDRYQAGRVDMDHIFYTERQGALLDSLSDSSETFVDVRKLYLVDYERDLASYKPAATSDLINRINQGVALTLYYGHGSNTTWADERLFNSTNISEIANRFLYTILGSYACTVSRFEQYREVSLSEVMINTPEKGAIASIGATRETFPSFNGKLGDALTRSLFSRQGDITLGEAVDIAKGYYPGRFESHSDALMRTRYNQEMYVLLGEPVLTFARPQMKINFENAPDTLQALQKVRLSGEVSGGPASGQLHLRVFEGDVQRQWTEVIGDETLITNGIKRGNVLYSERLNYNNGKFSTEFVTPRKISFGDSTARIAAWAWSENGAHIGIGSLNKISISGTSSYADSLNDSEAPEIYIRYCGNADSLGTYMSQVKDITLQLPACLDVIVQDSTGIDVREEADEGLSFEIEGLKDPWHPYPLLEQTGRRIVGRINFSKQYAPGIYLFKVRAQDILGNVAVRTLRLNLTEELRSGLSDVYNIPNPMRKDGTTFYFKDRAVNFNNTVVIRIFNQTGHLVKVLNNVRSGQTHWDGRDHWGQRLANGLYYYEVVNTVRPDPAQPESRTRTFRKKQKLVISR